MPRLEFIRHVKRLSGLPITYVEIGCWQGETASWVYDNILTHEQSYGYGIDPYLQVTYGANRLKGDQHDMDQMFENVFEMMKGKRWKWIRSKSVDALSWEWAAYYGGQQIDLLYIDGSHFAPNVMLDFCLAWPYLEVGSRVIFDDYTKHFPGVRESVDMIMKTFRGLIRPWGPNKSQMGFKVIKKEIDLKMARKLRENSEQKGR